MTIENKFGGISKPYLLSVTAMIIVLPAVAFIASILSHLFHQNYLRKQVLLITPLLVFNNN